MTKKLARFLGAFLLVFFFAAGFLKGAAPLQEGREPSQETEEVDAIICWWKMDRSAVRVGEPFQMFLTCRVAETETDAVVVKESVLEPLAINLIPFSVTGGDKYEEVKENHFRFFRYRYTLEFLESGSFGQEVELPPLEIPYHLETKLPKGEKVVSKEKTFKLPAFKVIIHSLVEKDAKDIRDSSDILLEDIKGIRFKANLSLIAGIFFLSLAVVAAFHMGFVAVRDRGKKKAELDVPPFSNSALLGRMVGELKRIRKAAMTNGWDTELIGRISSVLRIVGAVLISNGVRQMTVGLSEKGLQGQVKLRKRISLFKKVLISSGVTAETVRNRLIRKGLMDRRNEEFVNAFEKFSRARHNSEAGNVKGGNFDELLSKSIRFTRILRIRNFWPVRKFQAAKRSLEELRQVWKWKA